MGYAGVPIIPPLPVKIFEQRYGRLSEILDGLRDLLRRNTLILKGERRWKFWN
jgi:hypothetical protein